MPAENIAERTVLFDGVCVLCSWWVRFIVERDPAGLFRFVPIQSPYGSELADRFGINATSPETNAVVLDGIAYFKADAAIAILKRLPGWSSVSLLRAAPRTIRNWLYDRVAKNRYELFGRTDTCLMPTPDLSRRFHSDHSV